MTYKKGDNLGEKNYSKSHGSWNKGLNGDEYKSHYKSGFGGIFTKGHKRRVGLKHSLSARNTMRLRKLKNGHINKEGYRILTILGRRVKEHRLVWELNYGEIPEGHDIHHRNGNKLDNCIENLEILSKSNHAKKHWANRNIRRRC